MPKQSLDLSTLRSMISQNLTTCLLQATGCESASLLFFYDIQAELGLAELLHRLSFLRGHRKEGFGCYTYPSRGNIWFHLNFELPLADLLDRSAKILIIIPRRIFLVIKYEMRWE